MSFLTKTLLPAGERPARSAASVHDVGDRDAHAEMAAIQSIYRTLKGLKPDSRHRAMEYAKTLLHFEDKKGE